ncbi:MAG: PA0069 family radical SAM protein [Verrucomicrobia bacterium]|nr:PA0069 family radical SAM protein [Verrucomicrobiota bacterium]
MSDVPIKGRGASHNPPNRFEEIVLERDLDWNPEDEPALRTRIYRDKTATLLTTNDSPDVGFDVSINPYRGCEHGCVYCYARPTHEYLGFSAGLDFESKIMVKENAPALLRAELSARKWKPQTVAMSGVTDCYQPVERSLRLTRGCLEVFRDFRNPVCIVTKNHLITRDLDLLGELARFKAAAVHVSVTTLDPGLARLMEPRASLPLKRLQAIRQLSEAGVPVGVMVGPVIPGLTDHELPQIMAAAAQAGAQAAGYILLRLPLGVANLFTSWLDQHFPDRARKILGQIQSLRQGNLNDSTFGQRMRGTGILAEQISKMFQIACRKSGILNAHLPLSAGAFRRPNDRQLSLFD